MAKTLSIIHDIPWVRNSFTNSVFIVHHWSKPMSLVQKNRGIEVVASADGITPEQVKNDVI